MRTGLIKTSLKKYEKRVPVYPEHVKAIDPSVKRKLVVEAGYGSDYGFDDDWFVEQDISVCSRDEIIETCHRIILPKPVEEDLQMMRPHQIVWGWFHCVQQRNIVQVAIDRKLTLIAWEAMHQWHTCGEKLMHIFYKNNEIAGYASVLHVLQMLGVDGFYGPRRRVNVIGYGSCSRGVIHALHGRGFNNIHVYSRRPTHLVGYQHPDVYYHHLQADTDGNFFARNEENAIVPFIDELSDADIICNCVMQDTDNPAMFVKHREVSSLKSGCIIIDVSCDEGMGFPFARPTTFADPLLCIDGRIWYYSVDHAPSYLWNAASREISKALLPYLPVVAREGNEWSQDETLKRAVEIKDGEVQNSKILSFQNRHPEFPHPIIKSCDFSSS